MKSSIRNKLDIFHLYFISFYLEAHHFHAMYTLLHLYTCSLEKEKDYKDRTDQNPYNRDKI